MMREKHYCFTAFLFFCLVYFAAYTAEQIEIVESQTKLFQHNLVV